MKRVLSGVVLFVGTIAVVWFASRSVFLVVAYLVLLMATHELLVLARAGGATLASWPVMLGAGLTLTACTIESAVAAPLLFLVLLLQLVGLGSMSLWWWSGGPDAFGSIVVAFLPTIYLALPIGAMVAIREDAGPATLFLLMSSVAVSDTAQYYAGRLAGRTALAPQISPKKTLEGAVGGAVFGALTLGVAGAWWLPGTSVVLRLGLGLSVVAAGICGDLFESMLKRSVGVKDSSSLIPGHGGILDRIDALLFAAPVYYVALKFIEAA